MNAFDNMDEYLEAQGVQYIELPPVTTSTTEKIDGTEEKLRAMTEQKDRYYNLNQEAINRAYRLQNSVKDWLMDKVSNEEVTKEVAMELADLMGFETLQTVRVSGTISFNGEIEISMFEDVSDLDRYSIDINSLDLSVDTEDVVNLDYEIDDVDFE